MQWLANLIKNSPLTALIPATSLNLFSFGAELLSALSDGKIDNAELHSLISAASAIELVILCVIVLALRGKNAG